MNVPVHPPQASVTVEFSPAEIDPKWRARWAEQDLYRTPEPSDRPDVLLPGLLPLSVGGRHQRGSPAELGAHGRAVARDAHARLRRAPPHGLGRLRICPPRMPAIETGRHPADLTREWSANYKRQLDLAGASFDWAREINSTHPEYYRWTQWMFLKLFERGLAYRATGLQWWCPICGALANEEVNADGTDWRGHTNISQRELTQWFFKITDYADELIETWKGWIGPRKPAARR